MEQIQEKAWTDPALIERLAIIVRCDAALTKAAFADIVLLMVQAAHGRDDPGPPPGAG